MKRHRRVTLTRTVRLPDGTEVNDIVDTEDSRWSLCGGVNNITIEDRTEKPKAFPWFLVINSSGIATYEEWEAE